MHSIQKWILCT